MTAQELEAVILELLRDIYKAEYIGKLSVTKTDLGYLIKLGMGTPEAPIIIYVELEGDNLVKFLKKDLRDRQLSPSNFGYVQTMYPYDECRNQKQKCCDKG